VNFDFSAHQASLCPPRRLGAARGVEVPAVAAAVVVVVVTVVAVLVAVVIVVTAVPPQPPEGQPGVAAAR